MWPWTTKPVVSITVIFVAIANNTLGQNHFFMSKIIRILRLYSMKIFCKSHTGNISKHNFYMQYALTTLKASFSIFRFFLHPQILYLNQILSYPNKPYINEKLIYSTFVWCINPNLTKNDSSGPGSKMSMSPCVSNSGICANAIMQEGRAAFTIG